MPALEFAIAVLVLGGLVFALGYFAHRDWQRFNSWKLYRGKVHFPDIISKMTGFEFETWTQGLFQKAGVEAQRVGGQGDHGIDVLAQYAGKKIVVQCKKYYRNKGKKYSGYVPEKVLRDLYGVMHAGKFNLAMLVTTGKFTRPAQRWAKDKPDLVLIDGFRLKEIIQDPDKLRSYLV